MSRLTHQLVATALAAIFAVVSCTGEALYYLLEADSGQPVQTEGQPHEGFQHHHGDGLWHHHGPTQSSTSSAKADTPDESRTSDGEPAVRRESPGHRPHTCVALALVLQIQQSLSNTPSAVVESQHTSTCSEVDGDRRTHRFHATLGARGPPLLRVV